MAIERTLISRAQPYILSGLLESIVKKETSKGCCSKIKDKSIILEPPYVSPTEWMSNSEINYNDLQIETCISKGLSQSFLCWIQPDYTLDWIKGERFLKHLAKAKDRICFEIIGNSERIAFKFNTTDADADLIRIAFQGEFPNCAITLNEDKNNFDNNIIFYDFHPYPPYHHLFTTSREIVESPFHSFLQALNNIDSGSKGFFQIQFEPVRNNWHQNIEKLNDLEYFSKSINNSNSYSRFSQQPPSGDLRNMSRDLETKAHTDKPFYSVAIRSGIITNENNFDIAGLTSFMNLFQHGGKQLNYLTNDDYNKILSKNEIKCIFENHLTYRSGFLLNSNELSGLVHIPSMEEFYENKFPINFLESSKLVNQMEIIADGSKIGYSKYVGKRVPVRIPSQIRKTCTHIIGRSGSGKSTALENLILQDIERGEGLAIIDPHGDTIKRILKLIPKEKVESTIYIDFGDNEFIPIWNPIKRIPGQSIGRTSDDLVSSFKSIIKSNAWGDRLEHLLRNGFSGLLHLDDSTLYDLLILFEHSSKQSREKRILTEKINSIVENAALKRFWDKDFGNYKRDDFTPPHHKLSKLLNSDESVSLMLSQPYSYIDFQDIVSSNKIVLFDLSNIGPDTRKILGSYLISTLHNFTISKNNIEAEDRISFNIYCDEAHKFTPDTLEDMITDARKFGVNLTFAHQYLNQFNNSQRDALLSSGSTVIFNVDLMDARLLVNNLRGKVEVKDIAQLEIGEAIARIGTEIVKVETELPRIISLENHQNEIIKSSREKFYRPISEVKRLVNERLNMFGIEMNLVPTIPEIEFVETKEPNFSYKVFE